MKNLIGILCLFLIMMFNDLMPANGYPKSTPEDTSSVSVSKWHPKMFYVVLPDLSLNFMLPYEQDQSGVHNLFFISKESGETFLLDTIKDHQRYFTPFSSGSCYDAILLYNNGKYIRYNNIIFENGAEVDMRNQCIQPSDTLSEHWKTMRTFDDAILDRASDRGDIAVSEFIIKGYVFSSRGGHVRNATVKSIGYINGEETINGEGTTTSDGYFEIDIKDDTEQTLLVSATVHIGIEKSNIKASCGLIIVLTEFGKARKDPR